MKLVVVAVGQRAPAWCEAAVADYARRFPPELPLELRRVKAEPRGGGRTAAQCMTAEARRLDAALGRGVHRVVLDEAGDRCTTVELAARLARWRAGARDVAFLIGGPDGIDPALRAAADERLRLSDLTLPHALVRVLAVEALYRAWSLSTGHPYHRE